MSYDIIPIMRPDTKQSKKQKTPKQPVYVSGLTAAGFSFYESEVEND